MIVFLYVLAVFYTFVVFQKGLYLQSLNKLENTLYVKCLNQATSRQKLSAWKLAWGCLIFWKGKDVKQYTDSIDNAYWLIAVKYAVEFGEEYALTRNQIDYLTDILYDLNKKLGISVSYDTALQFLLIAYKYGDKENL